LILLRQIIAVTSKCDPLTSIMPERLLDGMSDQEIKDMVAYLMKSEK